MSSATQDLTATMPPPVDATPTAPSSSSPQNDSDSYSTNSSEISSSRGRSSSRRSQRPDIVARKSSGTMIVPRDLPADEAGEEEDEEYPPDDARAMSPRRNSEETEAMSQATRASLRETARQAQLNLLEIAESIELVRQSHNQLQRQNEMLQDYIGGLTRSMSKSQGGSGKSKGKKK